MKLLPIFLTGALLFTTLAEAAPRSSIVGRSETLGEREVTVQSLRRVCESGGWRAEIEPGGDLKITGQKDAVIFLQVNPQYRSIGIRSSQPFRPGDEAARLDLANRLNSELGVGTFYVREGKDFLYSTHCIPLAGSLNTRQFLQTLEAYRVCMGRAADARYDTKWLLGTGQVFGVGVKFYTELGTDGFPYVQSVAPGSPAAEAGLQTDDAVISIDGRELKGLSLQEIGNLLAEVSTPDLKLKYHPATDWESTKEATLTRRWYRPE